MGGDGKAERRETSSLVVSLPIMPSRAFFPREDDWGRVSLCLITKNSLPLWPLLVEHLVAVQEVVSSNPCQHLRTTEVDVQSMRKSYV